MNKIIERFDTKPATAIINNELFDTDAINKEIPIDHICDIKEKHE
jgi:hypothetical protein